MKLHSTWELLSETTGFHCWPLSSSTGAVVARVFCSRALLTASVERGVHYACSLPLPRVFQADWGFKEAERSGHKPECVCFQATVGVCVTYLWGIDKLDDRCQWFIDYFARCSDCWLSKCQCSLFFGKHMTALLPKNPPWNIMFSCCVFAVHSLDD